MELRNQPPSSHPLTAPVHPPERVTGPPELHHSEGRYPQTWYIYMEMIAAAWGIEGSWQVRAPYFAAQVQ